MECHRAHDHQPHEADGIPRKRKAGCAEKQAVKEGMEYFFEEQRMGMEQVNGKAHRCQSVDETTREMQSGEAKEQRQRFQQVERRVVMEQTPSPKVGSRPEQQQRQQGDNDRNGNENCGIDLPTEACQRHGMTMKVACREVKIEEKQGRTAFVKPVIVEEPAVNEHEEVKPDEGRSECFAVGNIGKAVEDGRKQIQKQIGRNEPITQTEHRVEEILRREGHVGGCQDEIKVNRNGKKGHREAQRQELAAVKLNAEPSRNEHEKIDTRHRQALQPSITYQRNVLPSVGRCRVEAHAEKVDMKQNDQQHGQDAQQFDVRFTYRKGFLTVDSSADRSG